ncbi:GDSL Lipase/Acylhydrolase family protein [Cordyceps fumosorosea ARSEF 2679]|uniref:GDSL Lipase/Acylhydrolase family protein n=1 Tax=Cordyceps fumosorosea (strain ARSEF 2679) TaxID=1081104 RepID=A0A168B0B0_CORFA|nr:GDSL Lipase/Acylhydrolase family protein [Cordyceps fumosorosea ARSEF 2679]OAA69438.1 GDSL Lipase/Acylhydrolase family protein [Cordyceps fumosorosea ARSEF 2679]
MAVPYPQIVLLGDSLFQFSVETDDGFSFEAALQSRYSRRLDVVNRGLSGYNTANVLEYFDRLFPEKTPSSPEIRYLKQVILLGANDAVLPLPDTWQHVPLEQYGENLCKIIKHPRIEAHNPKILLVAPPPLDEIKTTQDDLSEGFACSIRRAAVSAQYSQKARDVAAKYENVTLIDLYKVLMDKAIEMVPDDYEKGGPLPGTPENGKHAGLEKLLPDGLHLGGLAYREFYKTLWPHIGHEWLHLPEGDRTGYVFPDWRTFQPKNTE